MVNILVLTKQVGQTPLQVIKDYKVKYPNYKNVPMTYAGRLDPMAEGLLLILAGEECKKKEEYLKLEKSYEATILLGASTDSLDLLGIPVIDKKAIELNQEQLSDLIKSLEGSHLLPIPLYSSVPIEGKPLHQWVREGKQKEISVPMREMMVKYVALCATSQMSADDLLQQIKTRIKRVAGDFRQTEIINAWQALLHESRQHFPTITIQLTVTSGTYIRALAKEIGKQLGRQACLFSLKRLSVGRYRIEE
jgi:tRNA pseudouridine55 synthase